MEQPVAETVLEGRYILGREIARGGFGVVCRARDKKLERDVAIKFLHGELGASRPLLRRFINEAKLAARVGGSGVVQIYDYAETSELGPFLVMEFLEGETLGARLGHGRLGVAESVSVVLDVLDVLVAVHQSGIVHRDLKPDNIFLVNEAGQQRVKVLDFGIARSLERRTQLTSPGSVIGTVNYMSPEQASGETSIDFRTDVFSMGMVLYRALSGKHAYSRWSSSTRLAAVISGQMEPIESACPGVPQEIARVVRKATRTKPADRFVDIAAMATELRLAVSGAPATHGDDAKEVETAPDLDWDEAVRGESTGPAFESAPPTRGPIRKGHEDEFAPGTVLLDKLRVVEVLGRGGMGTVYEVEHALTLHRRALKVMHVSMSDNDRIVKRFLREASIAGRLKSRHVAEVYDAGRLANGSPYILMERLHGKTLRAWLDDRGVLDWKSIVSLGSQICRGLSVAHSAGVFHRDLKPENIFIEGQGDALEARLLDFGIAHFGERASEGEELTTGFIGTPLYMAPEQLLQEEIGAWTDVYALAVVLLEAYSGQAVSRSERDDQIERLTGKPAFEPLSRALAEEAEMRYESADAFERALKASIPRPKWLPLAAGVAAAALLAFAWGGLSGAEPTPGTVSAPSRTGASETAEAFDAAEEVAASTRTENGTGEVEAMPAPADPAAAAASVDHEVRPSPSPSPLTAPAADTSEADALPSSDEATRRRRPRASPSGRVPGSGASVAPDHSSRQRPHDPVRHY